MDYLLMYRAYAVPNDRMVDEGLIGNDLQEATLA
jgi:hypothetical protein